MGEQTLAAAGGRLAQSAASADKPLRSERRRSSETILFVDLAAAQGHVVQPVKREGVGGQAVAPGAANFLIIGFDARRHVGMGDEAHVGLVDSHAESDGGEGDDAVLAQKTVLIGVAPTLCSSPA